MPHSRHVIHPGTECTVVCLKCSAEGSYGFALWLSLGSRSYFVYVNSGMVFPASDTPNILGALTEL